MRLIILFMSLSCLILLPILAHTDNKAVLRNSGATKHLADYTWSSGQYTNRVSVAQIRPYEFRVLIFVGMEETPDGVSVLNPDAGKSATFLLRDGYKSPTLSVEPQWGQKLGATLAVDSGEFQANQEPEGTAVDIVGDGSTPQVIRPWDNVVLLMEQAEALEKAVESWQNSGEANRKLAAEALRKLITFDWKRQPFRVEFRYRNPERLTLGAD